MKHFSSIDSAFTHLCVCNYVEEDTLRILQKQVENQYVREKIA